MNSVPLSNISKFPQSIQSPLTDFINKFLEKLGGNVLSVLVYGSAAGVNYNPGVSDINIAFIVRDLNFSVLSQGINLVKWGRKHRFATPLFLTREYVLHALDVFPIEFSEIKEKHFVIFGEDMFKELDIPVSDLRLLCEQQVKGKLLRLRQAYLDIGPNANVLKNALTSALTDLIPAFRQLIILKGQKPLEQKEEMLGQLAKIYALDLEPFLAVLRDKNKKISISSHQVEAHLENFLNQLEILSRHMDSL